MSPPVPSSSPTLVHHRNRLLGLPPNRVWRSYPGGATLDRLAGFDDTADTHYAEDWIGSVTPARNPVETPAAHGISRVIIEDSEILLSDLIAADPEYFLGAAHVARHGASPALLVKFLDSALRLHFQCHPTRAFARRELGSSNGKAEAYHILATRPNQPEPYIYVGFQRPPAVTEFRRWVEQQDIAAIEACFDRIPVRPGETYFIPGGVPHALGPGVFMVEIQEPSDLVARFEFERGGYTLPESARFMNRGLDFALSMLDFSAFPASRIDREVACYPQPLPNPGSGATRELLIGPVQTDCFRVSRLTLTAPVEVSHDHLALNIVTAGSVEATVAGRRHVFNRYEKYLQPAGLAPITLTPCVEASILECLPPA